MKWGGTRRRRIRARLRARDGDDCWRCGLPMIFPIARPALRNNDATIEHRAPRWRGGLDTDDNLALSHHRCNQEANRADLPTFYQENPDALPTTKQRRAQATQFRRGQGREGSD